MRRAAVLALVIVAVLAVVAPLSADIDFRHKFERGTELYIATNLPEDNAVVGLIRSLWTNQGPDMTHLLAWEDIRRNAERLADVKSNRNGIYVFVTERGSQAADWQRSVGLVDPRLAPPEAVGAEMVWTAVWPKKEGAKDTRYQQICVVAPTVEAAKAELERLAFRKGVPVGVEQRAAYFVAVLAPTAAMAKKVALPTGFADELADALVFGYDQWQEFLAAREGRHEVWLIDGSRWFSLPAEARRALPEGLVDVGSCQAVVSEPVNKEDGHTIRAYYAPVRRHLEALLGEARPRVVPLLDLRGVTTLAFVGLQWEGSRWHGRDVTWANELINQRVFALARGAGMVVVERSALEALAREHQISLSGFVDESSAVQIGKWLSAKAVLLGLLSEMSGETEYRVEEFKRRDGTVEKWAWHFVEHKQESARVVGSLRLISVETGQQLWAGPLEGYYGGPDETLREIKIDEVRDRKPGRPGELREGTREEASAATVEVALNSAVEGFWRSASGAVIWPSDGGAPARPGQEVLWGEVAAMEGGEVFASFPEESGGAIQAGMTLYVLREVPVGETLFYRCKAVLKVNQVQDNVAACSVVEQAEGATLEVGDLVCTGLPSSSDVSTPD